MAQIKMYSTRCCLFCVRAEQLLARKGISNLDKILVDTDPERREEMLLRSGRRSVPQIFIGERHVGGFDDLARLESAGELDTLLAP